MVKYYTRGPRKNAIFVRGPISLASRASVATFKLNNLFKKHIKSYLYNLLLFKNN